MRVWYDACTGKHVRYGTAIARRLRKLGHQVIFTTREHPDTTALATLLGEKPIVVGKWGPASLLTRVEESADRMLRFAKMFKDNPPEVAICHQSVELCRVAFGLGIPLIVTADTPHATAVNRLTLPLASTVVAPEAISQTLLRRFGAQKIVQFRGVDEVAWTKNVEPLTTFKFKRPLIVVRQLETRSAYALRSDDATIKEARKLSSLGTVVFLARYGKFEDEKLIVLNEFVDSAGLAAQADLVVSVGGTIAREAALQGTPSIIISEFDPIEVNDYLSEKGFPLFRVPPSKVTVYAKKYLGKKFDVEAKLASLEDPVDLIERMIVKKEFN